MVTSGGKVLRYRTTSICNHHGVHGVIMVAADTYIAQRFSISCIEASLFYLGKGIIPSTLLKPYACHEIICQCV